MTILATVDAAHLLAGGNALGLTKFREISANQVSFISPTHTSEKADKLTLTSTPPKPQPGNAGVTRTLINVQREVVINAGLSNERIVPIVVKMEVSMPVGASVADLDTVLHRIQYFTAISEEKVTEMYMNAIIPQ